jgi:hypothetical protein
LKGNKKESYDTKEKDLIAPANNWQPRTFKKFISSVNTSRKTAQIDTDAGRAYIKTMMSSQGHHPLACEWVGTQLAKWFGLPTLEFALLNLEPDDEIPLGKDGSENALPGPAFVTREFEGLQWDGSSKSLDSVENTNIITDLVIFDTWTHNWDRCPPEGDGRGPNYGNVFLTNQGVLTEGKYRILAIDHTECFSIGQELNARCFTIDRRQDRRIYGLFEPFKPYLCREHTERAVEKLRQIDRDIIGEYVESIPREWDMNRRTRQGLADFILSRATFLADNIVGIISSSNYMNGLF